MDRDTPVARIVHVSKSTAREKKAAWITEGVRLGIITPPQGRELSPDFLERERGFPEGEDVLKALLEERDEGR